MAEVKILVSGFAKKVSDNLWKASSTTTLIKDSGKNILVDPGSNKEKLLAALKKEDLTLEDIDIVFITHYHPDHLLNIRLFPNKDIYDNDTIYSGDKISTYTKKVPGTNIEVIDTPGHAHELGCLVVKTNKGNVVVAGDLWWWREDWEQKTDTKSLINHVDPYVKDQKALLESRKKILKIADWIIPGHGKMFKVPK